MWKWFFCFHGEVKLRSCLLFHRYFNLCPSLAAESRGMTLPTESAASTSEDTQVGPFHSRAPQRDSTPAGAPSRGEDPGECPWASSRPSPARRRGCCLRGASGGCRTGAVSPSPAGPRPGAALPLAGRAAGPPPPCTGSPEWNPAPRGCGSSSGAAPTATSVLLHLRVQGGEQGGSGTDARATSTSRAEAAAVLGGIGAWWSRRGRKEVRLV